MASIEDRGTSLRVVWRLGGKRTGAPQSFPVRFMPADGASKAAALKVAEKAKRLVESHGHAITKPEVVHAIYGSHRAVPAGVPTVAEWIELWLADRGRFRDIQPDTLDSYGQVLRTRVLPRLGHLHLTEIGHETIRDWVAWLGKQKTRGRGRAKQRPLAPQTIRQAHSVLHQLLGAAVPKWLATNPVAKPAGARRHVTGLPKVIPHEGVFLERWELNLILANASPQIHDLIFVAVRTGLRLGELLVLRVQDVTLTGRRPVIRVRRTLKKDNTIGDPKSEKSRRDVTISKEVVAVLTKRAAGKKRGDLLFPAPRGGVWDPHSLRKRHWARAVAGAKRCEKHPPPLPPKPVHGPRRQWRPDEVSTCSCRGVLKRDPRFHDLRHSHASVLVEDGWTPKRVQMRLGHANFQITMDVYGHLWEGGDEDRLDSMERLLAMNDDETD